MAYFVSKPVSRIPQATMATKVKIPETEVPAPQEVSPPERSGDLRTLVLLLVLTLLVFAIFLFKMEHPEKFADSVGRAKEGAWIAYSQVESSFSEGPSDEGPSFSPVVIVPDAPIPADAQWLGTSSGSSVFATGSQDSVSQSGSVSSWSGAVQDSQEVAAVPVVIRFGTYVIELEGGIPPGETVSVSVGATKMTVRSEK